MPDQIPSLAEAQLAVLIAGMRRLALEEPMTVPADGDDDWPPGYRWVPRELEARREHAAGTLETVQRLADEAPEPVTEPLTHFTTAGDSRLAADNSPVCEAAHWAIVSPEVRHVTCENCMEWLSAAVTNLTKALANAAATIERRDAEPEPEPPLPPGFFGEVQLPGFRTYTGWITREGADRIVSDWDGNVLAEYQPGPNCLTIHLPTPLKRPAPQREITAGDCFGNFHPDDDDPWGGDDDD